MLRRLFELEVPEIFNGLVEIKAMAREAGSRSKIAVHAVQDGIDPVGACVGQRGVRIQAIVNELNGEKIDVVEWSPDVARFIANSLSPAKVLMVNLTEEPNGDKVANVMVEDKQLSLAIGKEGQNARLAAKLTGWRIDIKSEAQVKEERERREQVEAERVAAMTPEEIEAERAAKEAAEQLASFAEEEPAAAPTEVIEAVTAEAPPEAAEPVAQIPVPAEETPAAETTEVPAAEAPVAEAPIEADTEIVPGTEKTFAQAWEEFEAEEEAIEGETPEEMLKRKADRRKRQTLVYDEKLGKVVAKRKRKGGRARGWEDQIEE
jgi:N utilization substance protein A